LKTENIEILNLSCGGCVNTITKKLKSIKGVETVAVDLETSMVDVQHSNGVVREQLIQALSSIGYPESKESNGLLTQMKSLKSCMIGKLSKTE